VQNFEVITCRRATAPQEFQSKSVISSVTRAQLAYENKDSLISRDGRQAGRRQIRANYASRTGIRPKEFPLASATPTPHQYESRCKLEIPNGLTASLISQKPRESAHNKRPSRWRDDGAVTIAGSADACARRGARGVDLAPDREARRAGRVWETSRRTSNEIRISGVRTPEYVKAAFAPASSARFLGCRGVLERDGPNIPDA